MTNSSSGAVELGDVRSTGKGGAIVFKVDGICYPVQKIYSPISKTVYFKSSPFRVSPSVEIISANELLFCRMTGGSVVTL